MAQTKQTYTIRKNRFQRQVFGLEFPEFFGQESANLLK